MRRRGPAAAAALAAALATAGVLLLRDDGAGPPVDRLAGSVPASARAYAHADRSHAGWRRATEVFDRLPALAALLERLAPRRPELPGGGEAALALLPDRRTPLALTKPGRAARPSLAADPGYAELVDGLREDRFAHGWVRARDLAWAQRIDASLEQIAASASVTGDRMRVRVRARHSGTAGPCSRGLGGDGLLSLAGAGSALYVELPSIGCALRLIAARVDGAPRVLGRFAPLLPLLESRGALIAAPGERGPVFTLVVDEVDEDQALDALAELQPTLIDLLGTQELGQAPAFGSAEVEGVTAATAQLAPGLELSYATWDGRLVVSTALEGIASARRSEGLARADAFQDVLADRPGSASALVFLDLDQLLALGEQAGLAEDPRYLAVRDDLQKLRAAGAVLTREGEHTTAELTFFIP